MSNVRYRILYKNTGVIFCNLKLKEVEILSDVDKRSQVINSSVRAGVMHSDQGTVYAFTNGKNYMKSSAKFRTVLEALSNSLEGINEITEELKRQNNKDTSRLIHNLTSHNAHNIQEIYSLISQDNVSKKIGKQIKVVEKIVISEPKETAITLLRIAKNNAAMKGEFSVFRKLFVANPHLRKIDHNVHKVLMNIFYLFFPDFTDKNVKVIIGESEETACFDYEILHVAFYYIIENSAKYIKPDSELCVIIKNSIEFIEIHMDMISIVIREDEKNRIFEEGYSGSVPTQLGKAGDGIGLSRVKKILDLSNGKIEIEFKEGSEETLIGVPYQRNLFIVKLPRE